MEGVGLGEKNEEGCVFGYFSFNMGECYGILCYGYLYFFSIYFTHKFQNLGKIR